MHVRTLSARTWLGGALAISLHAACDRAPSTAPTPALKPSAAASPIAGLVVLPNNTAVHYAAKKIVALRADGEIAWQLALPNDDSVAAPAAAAASSVIYVRGYRALHAASPEGKWLWSKPLEMIGANGHRELSAPIAMSDSTAVVIVGSDVVRLKHDGELWWRVAVPEGTINGQASAAMDGSVLIPTTAGLYSVSGDGRIAWRRVLGG